MDPTLIPSNLSPNCPHNGSAALREGLVQILRQGLQTLAQPFVARCVPHAGDCHTLLIAPAIKYNNFASLILFYQLGLLSA